MQRVGIATMIFLGWIGLAQAQPMSSNPTNLTGQADRNYELMLQSDAAFRAKRIELECGTIEDAQIRQQCIDSFPPPPAPRHPSAPRSPKP